MSTKQKVVVTRQLIDEAQRQLDAKSEQYEIVQWQSDTPCSRPWLLKHCQGAAGLLIMLSDKIDDELLEAAGPRLKTIASFSVGIDHIDGEAVKKRGIRLGYTPTCLTDAVADLAVMLVLMAQRRAGEAMRQVIGGQWPQMPWHPLLMTGPHIRGCTVGFLGFGRIGQAVWQRLLPFGVRNALYLTSSSSSSSFSPGGGQPVSASGSQDRQGVAHEPGVSVEPARDSSQLARESDVLVVACALTPSTKHLVNADFLAQMKKLAVLVNVARGPIVDTDALVAALEQEQIFGAGLDVIENEPNIEADHPILKHPRCVLLPHMGSATVETRLQMATESVENLLKGLEGGQMVNEVKL